MKGSDRMEKSDLELEECLKKIEELPIDLSMEEYIQKVAELTDDNVEFMPLSIIRELMLPKAQLEDYYLKKRAYQYDSNIDMLKGMQWRKAIHPILVELISLNRKFIDKQTYKIIGDRREKKDSKKPVILTYTHIDKYDYQIVSEAIKIHQYPVVGDPEAMYRTVDGLFLNLNGVVYCDEENKKDRKITTATSINVLERKMNLLIEGEGVWNITANLLTLPLFPGIIRIAHETGCDIIPIAIERYGKEYVINIGKEFSVDKYLEQGLSEDEIRQLLRDEMASLKWEIMLSLDKTKIGEDVYYNIKRSSLGTYQEELEKFQSERLNEWKDSKTGIPYYNTDIVKHRTYKEKNKETGYYVNLPEDAFSYMTKLKLNKQNAFIFKRDESLPDTIQQSLNMIVENFVRDNNKINVQKKEHKIPSI